LSCDEQKALKSNSRFLSSNHGTILAVFFANPELQQELKGNIDQSQDQVGVG